MSFFDDLTGTIKSMIGSKTEEVVEESKVKMAEEVVPEIVEEKKEEIAEAGEDIKTKSEQIVDAAVDELQNDLDEVQGNMSNSITGDTQ